MTETSVKARKLNDNDCVHSLKSTNFIDCNYFNIDDKSPASIRRISLIKFNSCFITKNDGQLPMDPTTKKYDGQKSFKTDIIKNKYSLVMFNFLLENAKKYNHFNEIKMIHSADTDPHCLLYEAILKLTVPGTIIRGEHLKREVLDKKIYINQSIYYSSPRPVNIVGIKKPFYIEFCNNIVQYYGWKVNPNDLLDYFTVTDSSHNILCFVLIKDIKPECLPEIIKKCKKKIRTNRPRIL